MKNIIKSLLVFSLTIIGFSCTDPDLDPLQSEKVLKGTLLALRGPQLDAIYFDGDAYGAAFYYNAVTGTETFDYDAEFLAEDPTSIESVEIFVIKRPSKERISLTTIAGSTFAKGDYRGPSISVSLTLASILTKIGADLSTPAGQDAFIALYKDGIQMESDLTLKDGTKVLAADLVAAGLFDSDQFYPAQKMIYGVEDIDDAKPVATTSLRGQVVKDGSGKVTSRPVLPLMAGALDTLNIVFDQKITTPPTVTFSPANAGTAGAPVAYGTSGKSFYVPFVAGAAYTGDAKFTISGATSGEPAPLAGLVQVTKTANIAVDNLAPQNLSFTTGTRIGKGQSAAITLKFNEALGTAPTITVDPGTTGIVGVTAVKTTLSADGLTATYAYEYKAGVSPTHGDATIIVVTPGKDKAGNSVAAIASKPLTIDLAAGPAPTVVLDGAQYDWGTQIKWTMNYATSGANPGGSTTGSVYYVALATGSDAPTGFVGGDVPAFTLATGTSALQSGSVSVSSGTSGSVYSAFTPNGDLDVYVVFLSNTGVISAISAPKAVTMN
jgi:hypothetical protein